MLYFPLVNIIFLILIYRVHRPIFWIVGVLEISLYIAGTLYIEVNYANIYNQILYYLALTGVGLVLGVGGFFIAISLNHRHLYDDQKTEKS